MKIRARCRTWLVAVKDSNLMVERITIVTMMTILTTRLVVRVSAALRTMSRVETLSATSAPKHISVIQLSTHTLNKSTPRDLTERYVPLPLVVGEEDDRVKT